MSDDDDLGRPPRVGARRPFPGPAAKPKRGAAGGKPGKAAKPGKPGKAAKAAKAGKGGATAKPAASKGKPSARRSPAPSAEPAPKPASARAARPAARPAPSPARPPHTAQPVAAPAASEPRPASAPARASARPVVRRATSKPAEKTPRASGPGATAAPSRGDRAAARPPRPRITDAVPPRAPTKAASGAPAPAHGPDEPAEPGRPRASVRRPSALLAAPPGPTADTRTPRPRPQPAPVVRLEPSSPGTVSAPSDAARGRARPAARASTAPRAPEAVAPEPPAQPEIAPSPVEPPVSDDVSLAMPALPDEPTPPPPAIEVAIFDDTSQPPPAPARGRPSSAPPPAVAVPDDALYEVEQTIDRFLGDVASVDDREARRRAAEAFAQVAAHLGGTAETERGEGLTRELLRPGYYVRQWGRLGLRNRSEEVDELGLDRAYEARFLPLFETVYRRWFRVAARGLDNVPSEGRCLVVANHGGALPWDGLMLRTAMRLEHPSRRELRWLTEDFVSHAPFLGAFTNRVGAVRACPENAERMLSREMLVAVFPEGEKGVAKPFRARYALQRFGRGGYVKLALRTRTPIVPTAIVGSEEAHPLLFRSRAAARLVGLPFLPVTPTFPWLGPLGLVPLPSRWVILCGEPIHLDDADPEDPIAITHLNDRVRGAVNDLVRRALEMRASPYL